MSALSVACQALHTALLENADRDTLIALSTVVSRQAAAADHELSKHRTRGDEKAKLLASLSRYVSELADEAAHVAPVLPLRPIQEPASAPHGDVTDTAERPIPPGVVASPEHATADAGLAVGQEGGAAQ